MRWPAAFLTAAPGCRRSRLTVDIQDLTTFAREGMVMTSYPEGWLDGKGAGRGPLLADTPQDFLIQTGSDKEPSPLARSASMSDLTEGIVPIALARIRIPRTPLTATPAWRARTRPSFSSIRSTSAGISVANAIASASPRSRSFARTAANEAFAIRRQRSHPASKACSMEGFPSGLGRRSSSRLTASGIHTSRN